MRIGHAVAAHLLLTASIIFVYVFVGPESFGFLIAALIFANVAPLLVRYFCLGLSHAPHKLPFNRSDLHDGPFHKNSLFIHSYPLIVSLLALFVLLLPLMTTG